MHGRTRESDAADPANAGRDVVGDRRAGRLGFVGRRSEMAVVASALESAHAGEGTILLVNGESGIGKTRLVSEAVARAQAQGARVLVGRCRDGAGMRAYRPWIDVLERCVAVLAAERGDAPLETAAADAARLVAPDPDAVALPAGRPRLKATQSRFRVFEGVATLLRAVAEPRTLVVVLDDLQCADHPSLQLLAFIARACADARLLVIGIYRDAEIDAEHPLAAAVAELNALPSCSRLAVGGLPEADVAELISQVAGRAAPPAIVARVFRETDGNPFFVGEIVRLLAHQGQLDAYRDPSQPLVLPRGVRAVIGRRLAGLSTACLGLLRWAAVLGREFSASALVQLAGRPTSEVLDDLAPAVDIDVIGAVAGQLGRFRFAHALIRDTLYQDVASSERARLHRQVGEALERLHEHAIEAHLAEIAHHFFEAARGGILDRAFEYVVRAAHQALAILAYEEAAEQYVRALQLLELVAPEDDGSRCVLLIGLGDARTRAADFALAKEAYARAAELAIRLPAAELLARAALGVGMRTPQFANDAAFVAMLERALAALGDHHDGLRARVLGRLARALVPDDAERRQSLCDEAIRIARRLGDPGLLAEVLWEQHYALWHPDNLEQRITMAREIVRLADAIGDREIGLLGTGALVSDLLEAGDYHTGKRTIASFAAAAEQLRQPRFLQWAAQMQATIARLEGRFDEAERLGEYALSVAQRAQDEMGHVFYGLHLMDHRRYTGGLAGVEAMFRTFVGRFRSHPVARCVMAWFDAQLGRTDDVRAELDRLARDDFATLPKDATWLTAVAALSEACTLLRDAGQAATLYRMVEPYAGRLVGVDFTFFFPFSAILGRLATTLGRWSDASAHFAAARETCARIGSVPLRAMVDYLEAVMLLRQGDVQNAERARASLEAVLETATSLGMVPLMERARVLRDRAVARLGTPAPVAPRPTPPVAAPASKGRSTGRFRRAGEYWEIALDGPPIRLKDSAGLRCLVVLLQHPGRHFLATELAQHARGGNGTDEEHGDAGAALDAAAAAAYRRRLVELRAVAEDAAASGDEAGAAAAHAEMEFLARELAHGIGLGGRARRVGSPVERARINVTRSIKAALRRVVAYDGAAGRHLEAMIRTGTYCAYAPTPEQLVDWTF